MGSSDIKLIFFDHKKGERDIRDEQELQAVLRQMKLEPYPKSVRLESPNGDILTIAIGSEFGFVQFEGVASKSPYLMAIDKSKKGPIESSREVDAGGTPTPIPIHACLPPDQIIEIVTYYAKNLEIPKHIDWEEV